MPLYHTTLFFLISQLISKVKSMIRISTCTRTITAQFNIIKITKGLLLLYLWHKIQKVYSTDKFLISRQHFYLQHSARSCNTSMRIHGHSSTRSILPLERWYRHSTWISTVLWSGHRSTSGAAIFVNIGSIPLHHGLGVIKSSWRGFTSFQVPKIW